MISIEFFFFNVTATTEIYTLSLHDALPISRRCNSSRNAWMSGDVLPGQSAASVTGDRKSTRLNSSHANISYAVFCLKKKKQERACGPATAQKEHQRGDQAKPHQYNLRCEYN